MHLPEPIPAPDRARMYASVVHGAQTYNDEVPYVFHLEFVVEVLKRFGFHDPVLMCSGWLHDAIEDTQANYNAISKRFGKEVAELVYAVTSELGRNRDERNAKTYPKIKGNYDATVLKLADRIANVEYGMANGGDMFQKYVKEYSGFKLGIYDDKIVESAPKLQAMWAYLDRLMGKMS